VARRTFVRSGPRPRYAWVPARDPENTVASSRAVSIDLLGAYLTDSGRDTGAGMVIERIIGSLTVESQTNGSGGDFAMGITWAPEGGHGTSPVPQSQVWDWLVWVSGNFPSGVNEQAAGVFQPDQMVYQFDVRSRRRLRAIGDEVRAVVQNPNATSMLWTLQTRILLRVS